MTSLKQIPLRHPLGLILAAAVAVLGAVYYFEYVLHYQPCELCHWQRRPWFAAIAIGAAAILMRGERWALPGLALLFVIGAAMAGYHVGVEEKWWPGPDTCGGGGLSGNLDDILDRVTSAPIVRCDEAAWRFLGISMAGYNMLLSLGLAVFAGTIWWIKRSRDI